MRQLHFPVIWPEMNYDDTGPYAFAVWLKDVDLKADPDTAPPVVRKTGVLAMPVSGGRFGVRLESGYLAVPAHATVWLPPGLPHVLIQEKSAVSIALFVAPEVAATFLAKDAERRLTSRMTEEMIKHFAMYWGRSDRSITARRLASVILQEFCSSSIMPEHFAPLPRHRVLRAIARELTDPANMKITVKVWAARYNMCSRTLLRLTLRETGMTFARWRLHLRLKPSLQALTEGRGIKVAAALAGYHDIAGYTHAFTKVMGVTPGKYRDQTMPRRPF